MSHSELDIKHEKSLNKKKEKKMKRNFQRISGELKKELHSKHHMKSFEKYQIFSSHGLKYYLQLNGKLEIVFFKEWYLLNQ